MKKILVLGSGGLQIGQGGEFDYSGSQAIKAVKEEGYEVVLINPNIATVQTSEYMANRTYFLAVTPEIVEDVIIKEKPEAILVAFGGQTALNCAVQMHERGILAKHKVKILGTPIDAIIATEDRDAFKERLAMIGVPVPQSVATKTVQEALKAANEIGYPVIARAAYALGGLGSGFADNDEELEELCAKAFALSPQVLVEKSLKGWKEVEYEMVRDREDNCIAVCNMENVDPLGIHTGDSIVVAPSQTLTNDEYHKLRKVAIVVIRDLGIVGECNIQYALDPKSEEFCVIEVNARLSRSSALASKATGYPLAYIAAKLALGKTLVELRNPVTQVTTACFEPALDYIVVKMPRWDLQKFPKAATQLGSSMKSIGEVMAIGRSFEEALQKAVRMTETGFSGVVGNGGGRRELERDLSKPSDTRIIAIADALAQGKSVEQVAQESMIDSWFLRKIENIVKISKELSRLAIEQVTPEIMRAAKQHGFSDLQLADIMHVYGSAREREMAVRAKRLALGVTPVVKQIDTLAAEWPAKTNYFYVTYHGTEHDSSFGAEKNVIVLGGGCYRIGSSVEFDWCCVACVHTLRERNYTTTVINCNPETVSTDYDICDRLYFEELSLERVLDIASFESPIGVVVSFGGQTPNNLVMGLHASSVPILGTAPEMIDTAEDRNKFSALLDRIEVDQPEWTSATSVQEAEQFARRVGYPVIVRPSYVLSGAAMRVVTREEELEFCLSDAAKVTSEYPVVVSKFVDHAKEIEIDAVARNGEVLAYALAEHVEYAGVHSGDATLVLPAQRLWLETVRKIKRATRAIAKELNINGPFNIQYLAKENEIKVIECNLRCSRTFPFSSKVIGLNFVEMATRVLVGEHVEKAESSLFELDHVGVKAPNFSFTRLAGADPVLGVEMSSTGEVASIGEHMEDAFLNATLASGGSVPKKGILLSTGALADKLDFVDEARALASMGYALYGTHGTAAFLAEQNISCTAVHWPDVKQEPNALTLLREKLVDLVVNIPKSNDAEELYNDYLIRRTAVDRGISLITNLNCAKLFVRALEHSRHEPHEVKSWQEFVTMR